MSAGEVEHDNEWLPDARSCPSWCDKAHTDALAEGTGWEDSRQHRTSGGAEVLTELGYADRPVRVWGAGWDLTAKQRPSTRGGGSWGPPLIGLDVNESSIVPGRRAAIELTSGEARVLAAQLAAMADRLDLT